MARNKVGTGRAWAGWVLFGGVMLTVIGAVNIAQGTVALIDDKWVIVTGGQLVAVDLTGWAWALISFGIVLALTGVGLFSGQSWARITAIIVVGLHAISQAIWMGANPLWSVLMIVMDVLVIFALTAKWPVVKSQLDPYADEPVAESRPDTYDDDQAPTTTEVPTESSKQNRPAHRSPAHH